jgi:hypothetical protein
MDILYALFLQATSVEKIAAYKSLEKQYHLLIKNENLSKV